MTTVNEYQQTIGAPLPAWTARPLPARVVLQGRFCRLEPLSAERHAAQLYAAFSQAADHRLWTYLTVGPFANEDAYCSFAQTAERSTDPMHFAVIDLARGTAVGTLALMRIDASHGVIEVGNVMFSPLLQRTPLSTEAQFLLMQYAFADLGYRRYEWKCDSLNAPSRRTALRLGFTYEGIFRQALVYKGRSRDTAWFSITDQEWPQVRQALTQWLAPNNINAGGQQQARLESFRAADKLSG